MKRIALTNCEKTILEEIADKAFTRDNIAQTYAFCIESISPENPDFTKINHAIVERWSTNALIYIKEKAWKLIEKNGRKVTNSSRINPAASESRECKK